MAKKIEVYVDTSAFISFLDKSDTHHALFSLLFSNPPRLISSSLVVAEGHAWFLRRYDSTRALQFLNFIDDLRVLTIQNMGFNEIQRSRRFLEEFSDQKLTLCDAVGLQIMSTLKIRKCWSTDRHLSLSGARLVINE